MLTLVPLHRPVHAPVVQGLAADLYRTLGLPVRVVSPWFEPEEAYDRGRQQVHSTRVLELLLRGGPGQGQLLAISDLDLFIPILTYVFGEAQLDGRAAVISTWRLRPEAYGMPADASLLAVRALKEALHELGHTWSLRHCQHPACVMRASTYVEGIDLKPAEYCTDCLRVVRSVAMQA